MQTIFNQNFGKTQFGKPTPQKQEQEQKQ